MGMPKMELSGICFIVANVFFVSYWCWLAGATGIGPIQVAICALNGVAIGSVLFCH